MRMITAILESDDKKVHVRVDYIGCNGVTTQHCLCDDLGNPVHAYQISPTGYGVIRRSQEILTVLQGEDRWNESHLVDVIRVLDALG